MATLKDLSRHLGISVTQVSRALNGHSDVSEATRERVTEAAARLGYSANLSARKLKAGRSGIVGMVVSATDERETPDTLMAVVIGMSAAFSRRNMQFVLHVMPEGADPVDTHARLCAGGVLDGFVVVNPEVPDPRIAYLAARGVPFVVHGRDREEAEYPFVDVDNRAIARRLAEAALAAGHRRIAFLNGPAEKSFARARRRGFDEALAAAGLPAGAGMVRHGAMIESEGRAAVADLFADPAAQPTAVIAGNMMLAAGVCDALDRLGLAVPGDVSVLAHDDVLARAPAAGFRVPLTRTVAALADSWALLCEGLVAAIEGEAEAPAQRILPVELVPGGSLAPPPNVQNIAG